jgi:cytoskeleton protein RodZ
MDGLNILPSQVSVPAAPKAGGDLRAARERLSWPLEDAAATLRIRKAYLEALEEGDLARLPRTAFALGFLRSYACALGLDPDEMLRRFKAEAAEVSQQTELSFPAPVPERGLPTGAVILLGVVLAVGAYVGWYRLSGEGRLPAETAATIPERLSPLASQALPSAPIDSIQALPSLSPTSAAAAPVSLVPGQIASATPLVVVVPPSTPVTGPVATPLATPAAPTGGPRVMLRASADAWVEVRDKSGTVLLNRVLHQGDTWAVPPTPGLLLTTGNAGATEVVLDGTTSATLGGTGSVRHDLPLDYDLLKAGKAVPVAVTAAPRPAQ